jgi:uncharacterized protein (TIGR02246 family)
MRPLAAGNSLAVTAAALLTAGAGRAAQEEGQKKTEAAAIHKNAVAFVEAFNRGDARAVAEAWWEDGDYIDQEGRHLKSRKAIEEAMRAFFAEHKGARLQIDNRKTRFLNPELAIEDGTTDVAPPDGGVPHRSRYTIVHAKRSGQWRMASVREAAFAPPTHAEQLRPLEWLIGAWADEEDKGEAAHAVFSWTKNGNFILSSIGASVKGVPVGEVTQLIGWDPAAKQIRSWTFESSGAFGEGTWARDGDRWVIKTTSTMRDGKRLAATNVVTRVDANTVTWRSVNRVMGGKALPDTPTVRMKRLKENGK